MNKVRPTDPLFVGIFIVAVIMVAWLDILITIHEARDAVIQQCMPRTVTECTTDSDCLEKNGGDPVRVLDSPA